MTSAYTAHTIEVLIYKLLFSFGKLVGTRGFEATAPFHDTNKNNNLAIQQNQKITSNSLKTPSSAYSLHTLISKRDLL
jgi:hypothetical protein